MANPEGLNKDGGINFQRKTNFGEKEKEPEEKTKEEVKEEIVENNRKLYKITEALIANQKNIENDINAIESSLDTLLKFINKNGSK